MRLPYFEVLCFVKGFQFWLSHFDNFNQKKNLTACECKRMSFKTFFLHSQAVRFFLAKILKKRKPYFEVLCFGKGFQFWLSHFDNFNQKKNLTAYECKKNVLKDILLH